MGSQSWWLCELTDECIIENCVKINFLSLTLLYFFWKIYNKYSSSLDICVNLKGIYVWTEWSIVEVYLADECLTFHSRCFYGIEIKVNRPKRNYDIDLRHTSSLSIFCALGQPFGKPNMQELSNDILNEDIIYVLQNNCEDGESITK